MSLTDDQYSRSEELIHGNGEDRTEFIRELVISLKFTPSVRRELCSLWKLRPAEIKEAELLARKQVADSVDRVSIRRDVMMSLEQLTHISQDALEKKKSYLDKEGVVVLAPDPDHKASVQAIKTKMGIYQILLLEPPEKDAQYKGKTLAELEAIAFERLQKQQLPEKREEYETTATEIEDTSGDRPIRERDDLHRGEGQRREYYDEEPDSDSEDELWI